MLVGSGVDAWELFFLLIDSHSTNTKKVLVSPCIMGSMAYRREVSPALGDCDGGFACDFT